MSLSLSAKRLIWGNTTRVEISALHLSMLTKVCGMWDRAIDLMCPPKRLPMFGSADDSFLGYRLSGWLAANAVNWVQIV